MHLRLGFLAFSVFLVTFLLAACEQEPANDPVIHGTINVALGNRNGLVVLTGIHTAGHRLEGARTIFLSMTIHRAAEATGLWAVSLPESWSR